MDNDSILDYLRNTKPLDPPPYSPGAGAVIDQKLAGRRDAGIVKRWLRRHPKLATFALLCLVVPTTYVMSDCMEGCASPAVASRHLIFGCPTPQAPRSP